MQKLCLDVKLECFVNEKRNLFQLPVEEMQLCIRNTLDIEQTSF